jgi:hypothetical protein
MGMFRVFQGKRRRNFSAVQTAWRRGVDSNPRYRSEWRERRRLRKLQAISHLSGDKRLGGVAVTVVIPCGFQSNRKAIGWRFCG